MYTSSQWLSITDLAAYLDCDLKAIRNVIKNLTKQELENVIHKHPTGYRKVNGCWEEQYAKTYDKFEFERLLNGTNREAASKTK